MILVIVGQDVRHTAQLDSIARADTLRIHADSIEREASQRAKVLVVRDTVLIVRDTALLRREIALRARTQEVQAEPVSEGCAEAVAERDGLIEDWKTQAADWKTQAADWKTQAADWKEQYGQQLGVSALLRAGNDTLKRVIESHTRPRSLLGRLLHPELRPAITAGACLTGCSGLGVMAGISVSF